MQQGVINHFWYSIGFKVFSVFNRFQSGILKVMQTYYFIQSCPKRAHFHLQVSVNDNTYIAGIRLSKPVYSKAN